MIEEFRQIGCLHIILKTAAKFCLLRAFPALALPLRLPPALALAPGVAVLTLAGRAAAAARFGLLPLLFRLLFEETAVLGRRGLAPG